MSSSRQSEHYVRDVTPRGRTVVQYRMADIDGLPSGRECMVLAVRGSEGKKPGSVAQRNYHLYGQVGVPQVTVEEYISSYPQEDGGVARARASLLWDMDHGNVRIVRVERPRAAPRSTVAGRASAPARRVG